MISADRFDRCLPLLLADEGGFVNDPKDPGGATNLGVTKSVWEGYVGHPVSLSDMQALTGEKVAPLYKDRYWSLLHCDAMPSGLDYMVLDMAVNQGPNRAARFLQSALGLVPDGRIGPATLLAIRGCDVPSTIRAIRTLREAAYRELSTFPRFGHGWLSRIDRVQAAALGMVGS